MTADTLIGRQLGNFQVERLLGRGGMASVYYGWDVKLQRPVAIKVIDACYRDGLAYAERFVREARAVATWRHENIVQVYYADEEDGLYYFAMEYIDGPDLGELLGQYAADGELMAYADVLLVGRAVANALDYAHQAGVIHRDVKPSNVMVTSTGRVILTDFGLAMDAYQGSLGEVFGSPHYIAPEQARSSADAVPQSDLYALGIVLYEMLTGALPFDDLSATTVALQHITKPPPPPREFNSDLSEAAEAVLLKALSKSPEERYQTGAELIDALETALLASQPVSAPEEESELPSSPPGVEAPAARSLSKMSISDKVSLHSQAQVESATTARSTGQAGASLLGMQLDEYRLDALLGKGGMARIYRGLDARLKRRVAIKVIDTAFRTDAEYATRFEREAQAIAKLEHPHIVRLYRYGKARGLLYMAMQYIEGADLGAALANYQTAQAFIESQEASRIIRQICLALDYAHRQGVIHRDVKPSNIMLDEQGQVYLADFGLALLSEFGTRGEVFGSPRYMAPEQIVSSAKVVPQSDLYAVGVILYEMFAGTAPFDAEDPIEVATLQMTESPHPPRDLRPEISPELEAVILKALAKEPEERYQSGAELANALDQALGIGSAEAGVSPTDTIMHLPPLEPIGAERAKQPPAPVPIAVAVPIVQPAKEEATPASAKPARPVVSKKGKRLLLYVLVAIPLCMLLGLASGLRVLVGSPILRSVVPQLQRGAAATKTAVASTVGVAAQTGASTAAYDSPVTVTGTTAPISTSASETRGAAAVFKDTATPGYTPLPTKTSTSTRRPASTGTPTSTYTPKPTLAATPSPSQSHELRIVSQGEDSLFVVNQTAIDFPLAPLRLGDGRGRISGAEWGVAALKKGECVTVWKGTGHPKSPKGLRCKRVGERLTRNGPSRFWKDPFRVYYEGKLIGTCSAKPKACSVSVPR